MGMFKVVEGHFSKNLAKLSPDLLSSFNEVWWRTSPCEGFAAPTLVDAGLVPVMEGSHKPLQFTLHQRQSLLHCTSASNRQRFANRDDSRDNHRPRKDRGIHLTVPCGLGRVSTCLSGSAS